MTSINPVYVVAQPQQAQKNRTEAHVGNAAVATAGLGATGLAARNVINDANSVYWNEISNFDWKTKNGKKVCLVFKPDCLTSKLYKRFEKLGQKLFGENTKIGQAIERYVTGNMKDGGRMASPEQIAALVKRCKTLGAVGVVAAPLVLGILGLASYKAGKIDG